MATVYLCEDSTTLTRVAVKVLRDEIGSAVVVERFLREIEFASQLDHPRIPKVLDSGTADGIPFYVMTYIEGESLRDLLDRVKQLPIDEALSIASAVMEPMAYAHRMGIVHRDIKPGNILIGVDGVRVLDFGIARAIVASADDRLTSTGIAIGTPAYMSPEQALGDHNLDARSDIYSLGCVVYEMIAGIPPFVGATPQAAMARRFAAVAPPLSETRDGVPAHIVSAVARALSRTPADRWQTVKQFSDAISSLPSGTAAEMEARLSTRRQRLARIGAFIGLSAAGLASAAAYSVRYGLDNDVRSAWSVGDFATAERLLKPKVIDRSASGDELVLFARSLNLQSRPASEWIDHLRQALEKQDQLGQDERVIAHALLAVSTGDFSKACPALHRQTLQSLNSSAERIAGAVEYADCLLADNVVVADKKSPTGFAFRSSYARADSIYSSLLVRNSKEPSIYELLAPRIRRVWPIDKSTIRTGVAAGDATLRFRAQPSLEGDSIAFIPIPVSTDKPWIGGDPDALADAITIGRRKLTEMARRWLDAEPNAFAAHALYAEVLEAAGILEDQSPSAAEQLRLARLHAPAPLSNSSYLNHLKLGLNQVRLMIRASRFDRAGLLADSMLALRVPAGLDDTGHDERAVILTSLAMLRGKGTEAAKIAKRFSDRYPVNLPNGKSMLLPARIGETLIHLDVMIALGDGDSILQLKRRIEQDALSLLPATYSADVARRILRRPLSLAAPLVGLEPLRDVGPGTDAYARALTALAHGDRRTARALLDSLDDLHATYAPGEITMDVVFSESWLNLELGDTSAAKARLDRALGGVTAALPAILHNGELAAFLVRAMAFRAQLAAATGEEDVARRWSDAVLGLWGNGDSSVRITVSSVRRSRRQSG